jgi:hypothetical protein
MDQTMIVYDLQCRQGHNFEGWFDDLKAFKHQKKERLIACPICNDTQVSRKPSTFAIKGSRPSTPTTPKPEAADPEQIARTVSEFVETNFDNVGTDFASEALKIHYGVNKPRNIRGVSTSQEEDMLRQEGVDFVKLPIIAKETPPSSDSDG